MLTTVYSPGWRLEEEKGEMIIQAFGFVCAFEPKNWPSCLPPFVGEGALWGHLTHSLCVFRAHVPTSTRPGQIYQHKLQSWKWESETQNMLSAQTNSEPTHFFTRSWGFLAMSYWKQQQNKNAASLIIYQAPPPSIPFLGYFKHSLFP